MKKLGKLICFTAVVSAVAGGIAYLMKKDREKAVPELEEENGDTFEEDLKDLFEDFKDETKGKACTVKEQVKDAAGEIKETITGDSKMEEK